jgi:antitoxin (DNA-binding transcriptional repressor) of toxin-antitoxin stability system
LKKARKSINSDFGGVNTITGLAASPPKVYIHVHKYVRIGVAMKTTNFTEFRKHAAEYLDLVEQGETVRILRHGKPVADFSPVPNEDGPSWKKAPPQVVLSGVSLSKSILQNRADSTR